MVPEGPIVRRAQPWLGTCVEIRAEAARLPRWEVMAAIDAAFAEIAAVHHLLSRQDRGTDYLQLTQARAGDVEGVGDVRLLDVDVVRIEQQAQCGVVDLIHQLHPLGSRVDEIGFVAVKRLEGHPHAVRAGRLAAAPTRPTAT